MADKPDVFFLTPHWHSSPHVLVWLARADLQQLRELLTDALARAGTEATHSEVGGCK